MLISEIRYKGPAQYFGPEHCKALEYPEAYYHSCTFLRKVAAKQPLYRAHMHLDDAGEASACSSVLLIPLPSVHKSLHAFVPWVLIHLLELS